ncbi:MAG: VWA domain-containing protein, partial [Chitinispirillaceae bacterium]
MKECTIPFRIKTFLILMIAIGIEAQVLYTESFEDTVSMTGSGQWEFGIPGSGPDSAFEGNRCAATNLNGVYGSNSYDTLITPSIVLPDQDSIYLSFYEWYELESYHDYIHVEIKQSGSAYWQSLRSSISSTNANWTENKIPLTTYKNSSVRIRFRLESNGSNNNYGWYVDNIRVYTPVYRNLHITVDGLGTVSPSGTLSVHEGQATLIQAQPDLPYFFSGWATTSGNARLTDSDSLSTYAILDSSDATVTARLEKDTVYYLSHQPDTFNMNSSDDPATGVLYAFECTQTGSYQFDIGSISSTYRRIDHYGEDTLFSTPLTTTGYSYSPSITFAADSGETHFFRVRNQYAGSSYYTYDYGVRINESRQLIVESDGNGTTMPTDTVSVFGDTLLRAFPSTPLFYFRNWRTSSGSASISDTLSRTTNVTLDTSDAAVKAFFAKDTIHNLDFSLDTMNMNASFSPDSGVLYSFTAPESGNYQFKVHSIDGTYRIASHYGEDTLFSTPRTTTSFYSYSPSITFAADSGETHFFRVRNQYAGSSYYTYDYGVRINESRQLIVESDGNGTTIPTDTVSVYNDILLRAIPSTALFYLRNWRTISGSASISDTLSRVTNVTMDTSDAAIKAFFAKDTIHNLDFSLDTMNMNASFSPDSGVLYSFTAPESGNYQFKVHSIDGTYRIASHYGEDTLFSTPRTTTSFYSYSPSITFAADSGETHFFRVRNQYAGSSYYTYDYGVRINESRQLIVESDGNGTTIPTDTVSVYNDILLRAIPSTPLFYLRNWRITSGSASITDTLSRTTKITLDTSDASVKAFFAKDTIHNLDFSLDTMNMTASFSPDSGVLYSFVAPKKGTYQLEVNSITNTNRRIDHYGEDSLFSTPLTSTTGYSYSPSLTFAADSGETHFLRVRNTYNNNTNYYEYDFSIRVNSQRKLVVESEGSGSTDPADTVDVFGSATLNAVPSSIRSHLKSWRIISGTADIADTSSRTTVITLDTSDVVVRATFEEDTVYTLSYYPDTMNMNASATPDSGVLYRFDAPHTDSFSLVVNSITDAYRLIDHYGNDSLFSVVQNASSGYYNSPHLTFHADSGETRYFRIRNLYSNSSYHSYDYDVRVFKRQKLRISTDGNGTTNPADSSLISGGVSSPINAVPGHNCVDFSHWSVDSGSARIADSLAAQTSITFDTTDAFITAHFVDLPHDTLVIVQSDRGLIYPRDTLFVQRDSAVSITAHPAGGYVFESWVAHEGSPVMSDAHSNHMTVTLPSGSATVGATFGIDTTIIPTLNITDIDISNHPDICITASVQDSSGRSIPGIDSSRFTVTQDNNHPLPFHMNAVSEIGGVSIALVIDRSGSMGTSQMDYAKESARSFINSMAPLDKAAILSFSTTATVDCALTSDKDSLLAAVDQISSGGNTNIGGAAYHGLEQLLAETNSKAVIVFSDGNENSTTHTTDQVVGLAKDNSIPIYSIGVGSAVDSSQVLKPIADSTGGYYRSSPDASGLADIYAQIKTDLEAQYVFCYRSDDEVFNGDQHEVILQVDHNSATVEDTAYWDESNSFPTVELTEETLDMIGVNQSQSDPITISAVITDDGSVASADLYYRRSGDSSDSYSRLSMSNSSADQYQAVITGADVEEPGIDFYIIATDNYNLAGKSPRVQNPQTEPHVIPVGNDAPLIDHLPVTSSIPDNPVSIRADITDTNGVAFAVLYYRKTTEARFTADTMLNSSGNTYTSTIPLQSVTLDNVDYYIRAVDSKGVFARNPVTGYHRITVNDNVSFTHAPDVTVSEMDSLSMVIRAHDPKGDPAIITLLSGLPPGARFDDSLADSTTLRWRPGCADQGEYDVELKAKSGQDSVSTVFTITVLDVNFKPDIHLVSDTSVWAKDTLNLVLSVNDCDSSVAALREESLPEGASFTDNLDGTGDFTWVPGIAQSGVHSAVFKITDSSSVSTEVYYDTCTITVDVSDLSAPQLTLGTRDTVVAKGTPLAISLTAAGADSTQPILIFSDLPDDADYDPDTTRHTVAQGLINWNSVSEEAFITVRACNAADTSLFDEDTVRVRVARLVVPDTVRSMENRETVFGA